MFTLKPSDPNFNTTKAPKNIFMCKKSLTCVPSEYSLPWSCFEAATFAMPDQKLNYNQSNIELTLTHQLPFPNYIPSFFFFHKDIKPTGTVDMQQNKAQMLPWSFHCILTTRTIQWPVLIRGMFWMSYMFHWKGKKKNKNTKQNKNNRELACAVTSGH